MSFMICIVLTLYYINSQKKYKGVPVVGGEPFILEKLRRISPHPALTCKTSGLRRWLEFFLTVRNCYNSQKLLKIEKILKCSECRD